MCASDIGNLVIQRSRESEHWVLDVVFDEYGRIIWREHARQRPVDGSEYTVIEVNTERLELAHIGRVVLHVVDYMFRYKLNQYLVLRE